MLLISGLSIFSNNGCKISFFSINIFKNISKFWGHLWSWIIYGSTSSMLIEFNLSNKAILFINRSFP